jgi:hypothetical protein
VPADDGRGFDDKDAGLPVVPDGAQPGPQPPICRCQFGSIDGALQNAELMTESEDLQLERRAAPETKRKPRLRERTISARMGIEGKRTTPSLSIRSEFARTTLERARNENDPRTTTLNLSNCWELTGTTVRPPRIWASLHA